MLQLRPRAPKVPENATTMSRSIKQGTKMSHEMHKNTSAHKTQTANQPRRFKETRISKQPNKRTNAHIHTYTNKHLNDKTTKVQLRIANTNTTLLKKSNSCVATRLRRFVLAKIRNYFFTARRKKRGVKIPNIKANIFFKSKTILFDSYIMGF